jgi:hypothetical protein
MQELPEFRAWAHHFGIERIRSSFRASITAMADGERQARAEYEAYLQSGREDRVYADDGVFIGSMSTELQFAAIEAKFAAEVVRETFVTSTFHFWERSARLWTGDHKARFPELEAKVRALGYPIHPELNLLNTLNNLLKHNNPKHGRDVFNVRAGMFHNGREPIGGDWQSGLRLTNEDVEGFIVAVSASAPQRTTAYP